MKKLLLFTLSALILKMSSAQITKHNWLVGGTGLFSSTTSNSAAGNIGQRQTQINLSPNIGYFLADKFAAGLKIGYSNIRYKQLNTPNYNLSKFITCSVGPFLRYYFLPTDKQFNLLVDGSYQYGNERGGGVSSTGSEPVDFDLTKYQKHTFSIAAGPVIYFNSSVGLEFLAAYTTSKYVNIEGRNKTFQVGLGLQVHLEKDK
jgi:hypothetical protein